jgi:hypothetical protein
MPARANWLWRLGLIVIALAALVILAASLSTPTFTFSGTGIDFWASSPGDSGTNPDARLGKFLIGAGLILALTLVVANMLLASRRKRPLARVNYSVISVVLTLLIIAVLHPEVLERLQFSPPPAAPSAATPAPGASPAAIPAALPEALVYGVSLAAAVLLVVLIWAVWKVVRRPRAQAQAPLAQQAAQMAQAALADWESGSPLASVIIRCYGEMSQLVAEKRAVQRSADMTPREFVERLEKAGVPGQPAQELTTLFELARYSTCPLGASEEAAARACLSALAKALETGA